VIVDLVPVGASVLDAGCGEGVLSVLLAKKGCQVTGVDISEPNIASAKKYAEEQGASAWTTFLCSDSEVLPMEDRTFDYVVSSHVLEHLPDFGKGVQELVRVAKERVIVAIPTCLNPCAWTLLGGDVYWTFSRKTPYAIFLGFARVFFALFSGMEGVDEGYGGRKELSHIWRFPWMGKRRLERGGLRVERFCGSTYILPYFPFLLPLTRLIERGAWIPVLRNFGYGTTYVCKPQCFS
jgi:SAM-dependent methyltransferase